MPVLKKLSNLRLVGFDFRPARSKMAAEKYGLTVWNEEEDAEVE
jgi:hypothetical protein